MITETKNKKINILYLIFFILLGNFCFAQQTIVKGHVEDLNTKEGLAFVNVHLLINSKLIGTMTDENGYYKLSYNSSSNQGIDTIIFNYISYEPTKKYIKRHLTQTLNIQLKQTSTALKSVEIMAKKEKYSRKSNPAVELIENVEKNKELNNLSNNDYYQYRKHEKTEISLLNINDSLRYKKPFNKIDFVFDNVQQSELNNKKFLPLYFMEVLSETYYRKNPENNRTIITAQKNVEISKFLDDQSIEYVMKEIFGDINIYNNKIPLLSNEFISPLAPFATRFYQFFIIDTSYIKGDSCIRLAFNPANQQDIGFSGYLWITKDTKYAVRKIEMRLPKKSGLNFVDELLLKQDYDYIDNKLCLVTDNLIIDCNIYGVQMHGRKTNTYNDFVFNQPQPYDFYNNYDITQHLPNYNKQSLSYWDENRISQLTQSEKMTYNNISRLNNFTFYKAAINTVMAFTSGYIEINKIDYGPVENTLSWNSVEGVRFRLGGKTNMNFNKHIFFEGFLAYGTKDEKFKYQTKAMYSFAEKKYNQWEFPLNLLSLNYEYNTNIPGQELLIGTPDRLFLSFNRGAIDKMTFNRTLSVEYEYETLSQFGINLKIQHLKQEPLANLNFTSFNELQEYNPLTSTTFQAVFRYARNEKFLQSQRYRISLNNIAPIYTLSYIYGSSLLGGDFTFHKIKAEVQKRWFILSFGFADLELSAGKIFGKVPYPLLYVHHANQNWAYQDEAFNLMNYFEFVSDQYVQVIFNYNFNGFIFNRIPLIKKLKWRECFAIKGVWGEVSDNNTPSLNNPNLIPFPKSSDGTTTTFSLNNGPYIEGNIGIDNIFNVLRIDYVRRFTYLENPNIAKWGIRFRLRLTF